MYYITSAANLIINQRIPIGWKSEEWLQIKISDLNYKNITLSLTQY